MTALSHEENPAVDNDRRPYILLVILLLLTSAIALTWGYYRHLDQDEVFVYQTDSVSSIAQVVDIQKHHPISLDPLFYHLLEHTSLSLFGSSAFALRLPSLFGFLFMQVCLFFIAKRIAGSRAGFIAAFLPSITWTLFYAQQARPYAVLLGLAALLLLAYQHATRDTQRTAWLIVLVITLALALNTHYFAILLLAPLYCAEFARILAHRRIDWKLLAAIAIGSAGALLTLPFQQAAGEFRKHYYNAGRIGFHAITQSYRALFVDYTRDTLSAQHAIMAFLVISAIVFAAALFLRFRSDDPAIPLPEKVFLLVLAILPFFGFLLARFVTHSIEVRYILPTIIGISVLIAIAATPIYCRGISFTTLTFALLFIVVGTGAEHVGEARTLAPTAAMLTVPEASTVQGPIYIQSMGNFEELVPYIADPAVQSRIALVYSAPIEIALAHHDTQSLTADHMRHFTRYRIDRYEDLRNQPGAHLFILYPHDGWNWLDRQLALDHATITPIGPALKGHLVRVEFLSNRNGGL